MLFFQLVEVLEGQLQCRYPSRTCYHLGRAVIALVAVDPDSQFAFLELGEGGRREYQGAGIMLRIIIQLLFEGTNNKEISFAILMGHKASYSHPPPPPIYAPCRRIVI